MHSRLLALLVVAILAGCSGSSPTIGPPASPVPLPASPTTEPAAWTIPPEISSGQFKADQEQAVEIRDDGIALSPPTLVAEESVKVAISTSASTPCDLYFLARFEPGSWPLPLAPGDVERILGPASPSRFTGLSPNLAAQMRPADPVRYFLLGELPAGDYAWYCGVGSGTMEPDPERFVTMAVGEPAATPIPVARTITIRELGETARDGEFVRIVGLVGEDSTCYAILCDLTIHDAMYPVDARYGHSTTAGTPVSKTVPPAPNTGASGDPAGRPVVLAAEDGTAIRVGEGVALTGRVSRDLNDAHIYGVARIEAVKVPRPKPVAVTFKTLPKQEDETYVSMTGDVATGGLATWCNGSCDLRLFSPKSDALAEIEVSVGEKDARTPNTMWPLPNHYSDKDLRLVANDGSLLTYGSRIRVTGFVRVTSAGDRSIRVIRIDKVP